jgi:hypothetical protein
MSYQGTHILLQPKKVESLKGTIPTCVLTGVQRYNTYRFYLDILSV